MESRKPRLNIPVGMESGLRLDPIPAAQFPAIPKTPSPSKATYGDRFIPCRSSSRLNQFALIDKPSPKKEGSNGGGYGDGASSEAYTRLLRAELLGIDDRPPQSSPMSPSNNLFRFKMDNSSPASPFGSSGFAGQDGGGNVGDVSTPTKAPRKIPKTPHKVLDAPSLQDDFYLNLVDWSSQNLLAVGLGTCVYLWSASNSKVTKLCDLGSRDGICAVQWTREGSYLAIGTSLGAVQIWDSTRCKMIRRMGGHHTRTGVLAWSSCTLSSGSRDKHILQHDLRVPNDFIGKFVGHRSEVCGLKWSHDDRELASGGNDNQLLVWSQRSQHPILKLTEHTAAVKAIAWSPHQNNLLASGVVQLIGAFVSGIQLTVCNLAWCKNVNELVSTHGYSQNQIMVWKYPSLGKVATLTGHTLRVLYLAMSPDGQTIVTGAGDETLRFWNIFPSSTKTQTPVCDSGMWSLGRTRIR